MSELEALQLELKAMRAERDAVAAERDKAVGFARRLRRDVLQRDLLLYLLEQSLDGTWDWDVSSGRDRFSDAWKTSLGFQPDEIGDTVDDWIGLLEDGEAERAFAAVQRHFEEGDPYDIVLRYRKKSGETAYMRARGQAVRDGSGTVVRMAGTHTDVTHLVETERQLEQALADLRDRNQALDAFAHTVAHDLKAPLRGIASLVDWIRESIQATADEQTLQNLDLLEQRAMAMRAFIRSVFHYSRASRVELNLVPCATADVVQSVIEELEPASHVPISTGALCDVVADPMQLRQVIMNLLTNSLRHSAGSRVEVFAERCGELCCLHVRDDGKGLSPEQLEYICRPFARANQGAGLGISRALVERMGGESGVHSQPGQGADFWFTLPLAPGGFAVAAQGDSGR